MCGILGLVAPANARPNATPEQMAGMRDLMTNRGPDEAGLIVHENVTFAVRALKIIDPANSEQPMWSPDKRFLLAYNGELYNDAELRRELEHNHGIQFKTKCDNETVLHAFAVWGLECLNKLRGMFAFGIYDFKERTLILARDPLGIKPLYFGMVGDSFVFGSHIPSLLAHPQASANPDLQALSAYLTTIRTTTGNRTLFAGISTLRPAQFAIVNFDSNTKQPNIQGGEYWTEPGETNHEFTLEEAATEVREAVLDSVSRHLRSDVPCCMLLSGGLDSTILAAACNTLGTMGDLSTWCAGDPEDSGGDREFARLVSSSLNTDHHEVIIDEAQFMENWGALIDETGLPLSTPNETAIYGLARDIKPRATVALSGEGADELFAGYALPLLSAVDQLRASIAPEQWPGGEAARDRFVNELLDQYGNADLGSPLEHYFRCNSWIAPERKADVFRPDVIEGIQTDSLLVNEISQQYDRSNQNFDLWEQLLHVQRRVNLTGLLARLDTATMAAGVEGRTPFADVRLAELAMTIPMSCKLQVDKCEDGGWSSAATAVAQQQVTTKAVLRRAFADALPPVVLSRPKASFPLPFMPWLAKVAPVVTQSPVTGQLFRRDMLETVAADPATNWQTAWPMINIALWCKRWWG